MSKKIDLLKVDNIAVTSKKPTRMVVKSKSGSKTSKPLKKLTTKDSKSSKSVPSKSVPSKSVPSKSTSSKSTSSKSASLKKRGRRQKKILDNVSVEEEDIEPQNNSAVILRLKIDPSKLKKKEDPDNGSTKAESKKSGSKSALVKSGSKTNAAAKKADKARAKSDDDSSEGMFKNDIPGDDTCHKCSKNEKIITAIRAKLDKYEKRDKLDKSNKIYNNKLNFISFGSGKKITIKKTNVWCWWDGHPFSNLPCFLPELYHNNTYHVTGCFCSFNCALAYNLYYKKDTKIDHRKSLVYKLCRELYGLSMEDTLEIKESAPKECIVSFGGNMSIEIFRQNSTMLNKEYIVYIPPIKPVNMIIEERNSDIVENNDNDYIIKRNKPLVGKRSVISSMKMDLDVNDDE